MAPDQLLTSSRILDALTVSDQVGLQDTFEPSSGTDILAFENARLMFDEELPYQPLALSSAPLLNAENIP